MSFRTTSGIIATMLNRLRAAQTIAGAIAFPALGQAGRAAGLPVVKVAITPIEAACQAYYAQSNGYTSKAGIDLDLTVMSSSPVILQALLSGTYDAAHGAITTLILARAKGLPIVIIAPSGFVRKGDSQGWIAVPPNSTIKSPRDFGGKTFAVSALGTQAELLPRAWIDKNGGDSTTVKFIEMPFPAIADAIEAGRADCGFLVEPFAIIATKKGQIKLLTDCADAVAPEFLATAWCATSAWARAHRDLASRFAHAMAQAGTWANAHPDQVAQVVASKLKLDPQLAAEEHRSTFTDKLVDAQIQPWIDVVARYDKITPFPISELIFRV